MKGFSGSVLKVLFVVMMAAVSCNAYAMHPLITDDAGTQGKGKYQVEANGQYATDNDTLNGVTTKATEGELVTSLTYGVTENVDAFIEFPHVWSSFKVDNVIFTNVNGLSDISAGAKWKFFDRDGLSFAVKPSISLPTGDDKEGLGTGKTGYRMFFVAEKDVEPIGVFVNIGFIRNENTFAEEKNLWHASIAGTYEVVHDLKIAVNFGMEKNPDKTADKDPAFGLLGLVYGVRENLDVDCGIKKGLNEAEMDTTLLAGMTVRF